MRKRWFNLLILSALLLAACSQTTATPVGQPSTNTPEKAQATATTSSKPAATSDGKTMQCQLVSLSPTQGPTESSMFPPISSDDWVQGDAKKASMTVIEYSDFE